MITKFSYDSIPQDLKKLNQWVGFTESKIPIDPQTFKGAKAKIKSTWGTFEEAINSIGKMGTYYKNDNPVNENIIGVGFEFNNNNIVGIDLDHVLDTDGNLHEEAELIYQWLNSYTEISPSGTGLHIFIYGDIPVDGKNNRNGLEPGKGIEVYKAGHYLTMTGNVFRDLKPIEHREAEIKSVYDQYFKQEIPQQKKLDLEPAPTYQPNGEQFERGLVYDKVLKNLWEGERSSNDESSNDQALMNKLAYWCDNDINLMIERFRASPYASQKDREHLKKMGRDDYMNRTAKEAVKGCSRTARDDNKPLTRQEVNHNPTIEQVAQPEVVKDDKFFIIEKNKAGDLAVSVPLLAKYIKQKYKLRYYNDQIRIFNNNYYGHVDNIKFVIHKEIPEILRTPRDIENCEKLLIYDQGLVLKNKDLAPEKYIAFKNGVKNVETKEFLDYAADEVKNLIFINQVDYNWNPDVEDDPMTDEFFKSITNGKQEDIDFLYQVIGVAISNYRDFKNIFYFTGKKDSGKSQYLHLIEKLLTYSDETKDYSSIGLAMFTNEGSKELTNIVGKRANICAETPDINIKDDTFLKKLSGSDEVEISRKFLDSLKFVNKAILIFAGNTMPKFFMGDKCSFSGRFLPYKFKTVIPEEKQIPKIYDKLNMEYVIKKSIEQLQIFIANNQRFSIPPEIYTNREMIELESDSIYRFFKECVVITDDETHRISNHDLFEIYTFFMMDDGILQKDPYSNRPNLKNLGNLTQRTFINKIKDFIGEHRYRRNIKYHDGKKETCYIGIQIKNVSTISHNEHAYKNPVLELVR